MGRKKTKVDPTVKRVLREIDELAMLDAISEEIRGKACGIAEKEWRHWTGMKYSDMVDLAISLARVS